MDGRRGCQRETCGYGKCRLGTTPCISPPIVRDYVLPIAEAQLAHAAGRHAEAVALMRPAIGGMYRLGGSHTQQDVLEQLFVDAALKAGSTADIRLALERVAGRRAIPPERFIGWREAANRVAVGSL